MLENQGPIQSRRISREEAKAQAEEIRAISSTAPIPDSDPSTTGFIDSMPSPAFLDRGLSIVILREIATWKLDEERRIEMVKGQYVSYFVTNPALIQFMAELYDDQPSTLGIGVDLYVRAQLNIPEGVELRLAGDKGDLITGIVEILPNGRTAIRFRDLHPDQFYSFQLIEKNG